MHDSLRFILGVIDRDDPLVVAAEDFDGNHGNALRLWQRKELLSTQPEPHPVPSCPHCKEGVPYRLGERYLCDTCHSTVEERHLLLWRFDLQALLTWLARSLKLEGTVRQVDDRLWQLGSLRRDGFSTECFFARGVLSEQSIKRLLAYRQVVLLRPLPLPTPSTDFKGACLSLLDLLHQDRRSLTVSDISTALRPGRPVRFDEENGTLWLANELLGDVPVDSKEHSLLICLWRSADKFVSYQDLKHYVLRQTGSTDTSDDAQFCQRLKSKIKKRIPTTDVLIATTNKAEGYCLRRRVGEP